MTYKTLRTLFYLVTPSTSHIIFPKTEKCNLTRYIYTIWHLNKSFLCHILPLYFSYINYGKINNVSEALLTSSMSKNTMGDIRHQKERLSRIKTFNIQKTKIVASVPITSWEIDGETVETVREFIFLGSKITADDECSRAIKRRLLLGRKVMTKLDNILQSRDITLPTKAHLVKAMVFPVVIYGCESWTIKKAERQIIYAVELWCWRRLLRVPWTRKSNQSILKEISPEYSMEGLMLKLKVQYFSHLLQSTDSLEKVLMLRKIESMRRRE